MIRTFKESDLDRVMELWLETNILAHSFIDKNHWHKSFNLVLEMIPLSDVYVHEEKGTIQGFIGLTNGYIAGIFVSHAVQSKGIGKKLLGQAKMLNDTLSLAVYEKNQRAVHFYQREKFSIVQRQRDKDTNESELIMEWIK